MKRLLLTALCIGALNLNAQHVHNYELVSTSDTIEVERLLRGDNSTQRRTVRKWREQHVCRQCGRHQSKPFELLIEIVYLWRREHM